MTAPLPAELPIAQTVLLDVLRSGLAGVTVVSDRPSDYTQRLPLVHARVIPGGRSVHPQFLFVVTVAVDAYAADAVAAQQVAEMARRVLTQAQLAQTVHAGGVLNRVATTQWPSESRDPDQPSGLARYHAKYALTIRRP